MIIHSIENHSDASLVKRHHHLLELLDAGSRSIRVGTITTFRYIIVLRIVAPVELRLVELGFIYGCVIEHRLEMDGIDAEVLEIFDSLRLCEGEILALIFQTRCRRNGEITHVKLVDNEVGWRLDGRTHILVPSHRVSIIEINDSATVSIHTYRLGKGSRRFALTDIEGIELTFQIALHGSSPSFIAHLLHLQRLVSLTFLSILIKTDGNRRLGCCWGIENEHGFLLGIHHLIECLLSTQ